jgi:anaphase-promoting complex subunit 6
MTHRYSRAEHLLTHPFSTKPPGVPFDVKGKAREPAIPSRLPVGPTAMFDATAEQQEGVSHLVDMSVVCRYLAAQCLVRQGKWAEAKKCSAKPILSAIRVRSLCRLCDTACGLPGLTSCLSS